MTIAAIVTAAVAVVISAPLASLTARLAGSGRSRLRPRTAEAGLSSGPLRLAALVVSVTILIGAPGDLVLAGVVGALGVAARAPGGAAALVAVAAVGALRAGSTDLDHVAGAHAVLGPAILSPDGGVMAAAVLASLGALSATAALAPDRPRGGLLGPLRSPGALADALSPVAAALAGLTAAVGPPVVAGAEEPWEWFATRVATLAAALVVAAVVRRLADRWETGSTVLALAGAVAAAAGAVVALGAR